MKWCELTILVGASSLSDVSNVIYSIYPSPLRGHLVAGEVRVCEGELEGGGGQHGRRLQLLREVVLVVHVCVLVEAAVVRVAERAVQRVLLAQLAAHAVDAQRLLVLQQRLLEVRLAWHSTTVTITHTSCRCRAKKQR